MHIERSDIVVVLKTIVITSVSVVFSLVVFIYIESSLVTNEGLTGTLVGNFGLGYIMNHSIDVPNEDEVVINDNEDTVLDDSISYAPVGYSNTYSSTMVYWDQTAGFESIKSCTGCYKEISPFWYQISSDYMVIPFLSDAVSKEQIIEYCNQTGIDIYPIISSERKSEHLMDLLENKGNVDRHIDSIITLVLDNGYDGVSLNYEGLQEEYKDIFSDFIKTLAERLHQNNAKLRVFVNYQTFEGKRGSGALSQDLAVIGKYADKVILMALDYHYPSSGAGPIAPISFVEDTLSYTLQFVSKEKLVLCIPLYGYDWGIGTAKSVKYSNIENIMTQYGVDSVWSDEYKSPHISYTAGDVSHIVWFENADSIQAKIDLANSYEVYNIDFFRLGGEVDLSSLIIPVED